MSAFPARSETALLVIDVQTDVVAVAHDRDGVIDRIATLVETARAAGACVLWVQHDDAGLVAETDAWQIVPELVPAPGEPESRFVTRSTARTLKPSSQNETSNGSSLRERRPTSACGGHCTQR